MDYGANTHATIKQIDLSPTDLEPRIRKLTIVNWVKNKLNISTTAHGSGQRISDRDKSYFEEVKKIIGAKLK